MIFDDFLKIWPTLASVHTKVKEEIGFGGSLPTLRALLLDWTWAINTPQGRLESY